MLEYLPVVKAAGGHHGGADLAEADAVAPAAAVQDPGAARVALRAEGGTLEMRTAQRAADFQLLAVRLCCLMKTNCQ